MNIFNEYACIHVYFHMTIRNYSLYYLKSYDTAPEWMNDIEAMNAESERKGIPYTLGRPCKLREETDNYNTIRW
jgi:hypothetical protein